MTASAPSLTDSGELVVLRPVGYPPRTVRWGHCWQIGTPAYWIALTQTAVQDGRLSALPTRHRLGADLVEEVAICLLGGHGLPHQVGLAAFDAVKHAGVLHGDWDAAAIEAVLRLPLTIRGRAVRYRFPAQRARYLAAALRKLATERPPSSASDLRDWLLEIPGVGPKTAGWVVRNFLGSDDVAVIDIHLHRAGVAAAIFDPAWTPARDYRQLEAAFLAWARHGQVRSADLDSVIWAERARRPHAYTD